MKLYYCTLASLVGELVVTTPELVRRTGRIGIQPLAPFAPPTGTGCAAAV